MSKGKVVSMVEAMETKAMETQVEQAVTTEDFSKNKDMFEYVMQNVQKIGNKHFVFIPLKLLFIDTDYQRSENISKAKISKLVNKWNANKMDPIRVSIHPEEYRGAIIDGCHRFFAAELMRLKGLECEVMWLSEDPTERKLEEATLFATQFDETDRLTPQEKHKSNCLRKVKENLILQKMIEKYDILLKPEKGRGRAKIGHLAGFSAALDIAKLGESLLDNTFNIVCSARWNFAINGFSSNVLRAVSNILRLHPDYETEIIDAMIKYFVKIEPEKYVAEAMTKYPERKIKEGMLLVLEDYVCETLDIARVYNGGKVQQAMSAVNAA